MVLRSLKYLASIASLFVLTGCPALLGLFGGGGSSPAPAAGTGAGATVAPSIVDEMETSTKLAIFAPAALLDSNPRLEQTIIESQCKFHTADPPFLAPTLTANKGWTFNGRVNQGKVEDGGEQEAEALEWRSWFGFGWPKQQINSWPLSMVTLSDMPRMYLDDRLQMLGQNNYKLNQRQQDALTQQFIADSQKIREVTHRLVSTFNPDTQCAPE